MLIARWRDGVDEVSVYLAGVSHIDGEGMLFRVLQYMRCKLEIEV